MRPLAEFPLEERRRIRVVLFDIDDTLTLDRRLPARAYAALERLHASGLVTVPVTGRPAGWCDHIARMWPVDAVVGENGAFYFRYDSARRRMVRRFWYDEAQRRRHRQRLDAVAERVLAAVSGARIAADQGYRESDLAIDYCEDVPRLPRRDVQRIVDIFQQAGARAKVSSIHVNGWFGDYDKRAMVLIVLAELFECADRRALEERALFVGDSPNDAPLFELLPQSVGVANIREFTDELHVSPRWITPGRGGLGFAELAQALLAARPRSAGG
ncbi:MAG: HAD-IIB family hydrolase [Gammaproteobacteria bacterium]|nr:HAD-IIB family hydrolase [Gammaproteobacteria bacterium]NIR81761.1 HAD-IIB family hydrolase [Gammaproteobacteria bacterium]NIR88564.1 HAD-IIB family hydrolase [Gammaproteobacteria bacterium]NIU02868.1 HAD-IIB family hydrolase [Gammaproteobacteria bacterium]NIV50390.1 HAD-IIB family hydrolase [Gammaproteobacteria bacterium]